MLRKCTKKLLASTLYAIIGLIAARYAQALLCDVWRLECVIWRLECVICR